MSEFKYACPVCGQHIKCDSSQAGSVMECPTCFQKITVPQAPTTPDSKLIITGTKVGERPTPNVPEDRLLAAPEKKSPWAALLILLILACAAAAAIYAFRGEIFKSSAVVAPAKQVAPGSNEVPAPSKRTQPALVAPPANDTNWTLDLAGAAIPDSMAAGRIHGKDFICERAYFEGGGLMLRQGTRGPVTLGLALNIGGGQPESLAGQTINVTTNVDKAARVTLRWLGDDRKLVKGIYDGGYALRLEFGPLSGRHLSGKIYFCAPDETKSYVVGSFNAEIRRPRSRS
jgi:DNA-directed RNA polymerase subunit RPC12/RpoP